MSTAWAKRDTSLGLEGVEVGVDCTRVGAGTSCAAILRSGVLDERVPLLSRALSLVEPQDGRRWTAEIGALCSDVERGAALRAVALVLDVEVEIASSGSDGRIDSDAYFGQRNPMWRSGYRLVSLAMPHRVEGGGYAVETCSVHGGEPVSGGVAVVIWLDVQRRVDHCAIAVWGSGGWAERGIATELGLVGMYIEDVDPADVGSDVIWDLPGCKGSRARAGSAMVARAWSRAACQAQNPREAGGRPLVDLREDDRAI